MAIEKDLAAEIEAAAEETIQVPEELAETKPAEETKDEGRKGDEAEETQAEQAEEQVEVAEPSEEKAGPQEKEEPSTPPVSDDMLTRAVQAGLTLAEARSFPSEQALLAACTAIERGQQVPEEEQEEPAEDPFAALDKLNLEEFEPEAAKVIQTLVAQQKAQREELQQLRATQEYSAQGIQQAAAREVEEWFDRQVESLGSDFQESLGTGKFSSLAQGSPQRVKREQLADTMAVMIAGHNQLGRPMPPREEIFRQATGYVLKDEYAQLEQQKLQADLRKMSGKHIQRAGVQGKKTTTSDPEAEIAAILDAKFFPDE